MVGSREQRDRPHLRKGLVGGGRGDGSGEPRDGGGGSCRVIPLIPLRVHLRIQLLVHQRMCKKMRRRRRR